MLFQQVIAQTRSGTGEEILTTFRVPPTEDAPRGITFVDLPDNTARFVNGSLAVIYNIYESDEKANGKVAVRYVGREVKVVSPTHDGATLRLNGTTTYEIALIKSRDGDLKLLKLNS